MRKTCIWLVVLIGLVLWRPLHGQVPLAPPPPTAPAVPPPPPQDPLGRTTPKGTVGGLLTAAKQSNFDRAAEYLQSTLPSSERQFLAEQLWIVLDRKLLTTLDGVSDKPDGELDDGLTNRDRIGVVGSPSGDVEIFVERVSRTPGPALWLFAASSLKDVPRLYDELQPPWFEHYVPEWMRTRRLLSIQLYRWIAILLFIPLVFVVAGLSARGLTGALNLLFRHIVREPSARRAGSAWPLRLLVLATIFYSASFLGLTLATRTFWHRVAQTVAVIALCWLSLRLIDRVAALSLRRMERGRRSADTALVRLIGRLLKAGAVILTGLLLLYLSDVDLTAALTGLGVGGLAIGFGAQKTIENLFGGIMVISDQPIKVGDACRVGTLFGTVEDIGIRSTRIRTLDRTVVSVPNGQLAAMSLENFAVRDRILFHHTVAVGRQATADQLRGVLTQIRRMLAVHTALDATSARTQFIRVTGYSLEIELFVYVLETDYPSFLIIQEELLLGVMDILETSGTVAV